MKIKFALLIIILALSFSALATISDPALYVHAVCGSTDTEAWQKWQSIHDEAFKEESPDEKYFFLPSSADPQSLDIYNSTFIPTNSRLTRTLSCNR